MLLTARMYDVMDQVVLEVTHWGAADSLSDPGDFLGRAYAQKTCDHPPCHLMLVAKGLFELAGELDAAEHPGMKDS